MKQYVGMMIQIKTLEDDLNVRSHEEVEDKKILEKQENSGKRLNTFKRFFHFLKQNSQTAARLDE